EWAEHQSHALRRVSGSGRTRRSGPYENGVGQHVRRRFRLYRNGSCKNRPRYVSRNPGPTRSAHVKNPFSSNDLSDSIKRRIELAVAVAQERLLATHVRHALELIQIVGEQVPFENALAIYTRMLRLS